MTTFGNHVMRGVGLLVGAGLVLAIAAGPAFADDGASGAVQEGMSGAADSTKKGLTRAGEAVGEALDTAISKTGEGVSKALEATGNGIQRAGRALSGEPEATPEPAAEHAEEAAPAVSEHPIQEERLD